MNMLAKLMKIRDLLNEADYLLYRLTKEKNDFRGGDEAEDIREARGETSEAMRLISNALILRAVWEKRP
jgi:hypothetical protein